jgi:hypothetical protein
MKSAVFYILLVLVSGCASAPKTNSYRPDQVVGRMDELGSRPEWATESINVITQGEKIRFIGVAEVPADSRIQAAFKMSDSSARGVVANKVETSVTKIVENSEAGLSMEDQSLKSLIKEVSRVSLKNVDIKNRYWEKVVRTSSDGSESMIMKVFSLIEISERDMKKMLLTANRASQSSSKDIRNKVENLIRDQWDQSDL